MTSLIIALLVVGAVLFCVEMFIPGFGICGALGIASIVLSAIITIATVPGGLIIGLAEIAAVAAIAYFLFGYVRRTQLHGKIILDETLAKEARDIGDPEYFLGREGVAKTPLRPFGEAEFNGITVEVSSDGKYISANTRVKVIAADSQRITVQSLQ